ncbi:CREB3 regulatory factor isoform X2 [Latimeria chalumnae]|uniref:CREB3 regulatory factor isoform X2 n=1 Tax=Latimeria chalumnae TaxID=7897 RepID=UPI00313BB077
MPQPGTSGMEPAFGDAYRTYPHSVSSEQVMPTHSDSSTNADLVSGQEQQSECTQATRDDLFIFGVYESPRKEKIELLSDLLDDEPCDINRCEQWDISALEDFTKPTKTEPLGDKESGLPSWENLSSPYGKDEKISPLLSPGQPSLEHPVTPRDTWCLLRNHKETLPTKTPETQRWSCCMDPSMDATPLFEFSTTICNREDANRGQHHCLISRHPLKKTSTYNLRLPARPKDGRRLQCQALTEGMITRPKQPVPDNLRPCAHQKVTGLQEGVSRSEGESSSSLEGERSHGYCQLSWASRTRRTSRQESLEPPSELTSQEHNYSMFSSGEGLGSLVVKQEEPEASSGSGTSSGSEQEESENEATEEEEEDDDYEEQDADKEASSDYNSESENEDDPTARALSEEPARRQKRRYFWEYSRSQSSPTKPGRRLSPAVWDRNMLPSNQYQKENRLSTGRRLLKKTRRTDVNDLTPNPCKLRNIGEELKKLNKVIDDLTPANELPIIARPRSRKEKNKLASRACRLKKKAQHEANKIKLWGLNQEHDALLRVIVGIKAEIVRRVGSSEQNDGEKMTEKLEKLLKQMQGPVVAGQTSEFVQKVLERVAAGDPMGGLDKGGMMTSSL